MKRSFSKLFMVFLLAVIFAACSGGGGGGGTSGCDNAAGTWSTTENVTGNCAANVPRTDHGTYTVIQSGCNITVTDSSGDSYTGTINGSKISWTGSYSEFGGTTTINSLSLTMSGDSFSGPANWTWTDGSTTCSGSTSITGTRTSGGDTASNGSAKCSTYNSGDYSCEGGVGGYGIRRCDNGTWVEAATCSCTVSVGDPRKPPYGTSCKVYSNYITCDYAGTWCVKCVNGGNCQFD